VWAESTKIFLTANVLISVQKNQKKMYKSILTGNTIIRKEIRQHKNIPMRQHFSTYLIPIKKIFLLIDTRFFTVSAGSILGLLYIKSSS